MEDGTSRSEQERKPASWPPREQDRTPAPWPPRARPTDDGGSDPAPRERAQQDPPRERSPERPDSPWDRPAQKEPAPWDRPAQKEPAPWDRSAQKEPAHKTEPAPWDRPAPKTEPAPWDRPAQKPERREDDDRTMAWQPPRTDAGAAVPQRREPWQRPDQTPARPAPPTPPRAQPPASPTTPAYTRAQPAAQPTPQRGTVAVRRLRKGRLAIRKIDPWAVFKFSLVFYFCMLLIALFTVGIIFLVMQVFGVIGNIEKFLRDLDMTVTITGTFLFRWLFLVGLAGTLVASAVTMFMAFLYNLIADVVGGIELLVTERE